MTLDSEKWASIPGLVEYEVSDLGRVRSTRMSGRGGSANPEPRAMRPSVQHGRLRIELWRGRKPIKFFVHRLVLAAFVGPCPPGMEACHFPDRDPMNCRRAVVEGVDIP
jgi:hypothetical protein